MKENNKRVVFYSAEKDGFLESYKDRGSLVFKAVFDDRLWKALQLPIEFYEKQKTSSTNLLRRLVVKCLSWKPNTM
ncbi:hypothetical protein [Streptococcus salivarius]|uniref:hypothetical protein n=1 Tax=Streptococcus salivarius TaxID=1304 RepID=UPI0039C2C12C